MSINVRDHVAHRTNTEEADWDFVSGPETGIGIEYWLENEYTNQLAYVCVDQGEVVAFNCEKRV